MGDITQTSSTPAQTSSTSSKFDHSFDKRKVEHPISHSKDLSDSESISVTLTDIKYNKSNNAVTYYMITTLKEGIYEVYYPFDISFFRGHYYPIRHLPPANIDILNQQNKKKGYFEQVYKIHFNKNNDKKTFEKDIYEIQPKKDAFKRCFYTVLKAQLDLDDEQSSHILERESILIDASTDGELRQIIPHKADDDLQITSTRLYNPNK